MSKKPITSLEAKVKHTMEELYLTCRTGKIAIIDKNHAAWKKAKAELDTRLETETPAKEKRTHE